MRKIIFLLLFIFPTILFAQQNEVTWDFPVKPGSEEWKTFDNTYQKIEACQIPLNVLTHISTKNLIQICLNYPLFNDLFFTNYLQIGFDRMIKQFNGFEELIRRKDAGSNLLSLYQLKEPANLDKIWEPVRKGIYSFDLVKIELFLANEDILLNMTQNELYNLNKRSRYIYKEKEKQIDEYGYNFGLAPTALILGKIANEEGRFEYLNETDKKKIEHFLITGTFTDEKILETIFQNAQK
jgi:hypothetical protein